MKIKPLVIGLMIQAPFVVSFAPGLPALAQPQMQVPGQGQPYETGVAMTLYRVQNGPNGQFYINQQGQAIPLPGAGVNSPAVAIYSGSYGGQWYVDQTGQQIDLPQQAPMAYGGQGQPAYYGGGYGGQEYAQPYQGGYSQQGYPPQQGYAQDQYQQQQQPQVNVEQNSGGGSSGSSGLATGLAAAAGGALGGMAGAALTDSYMGMPYGMPMYGGGYGGGGPYYMGAGGKRVYVNNSTNNYNAEWQNQHNWYNKQVNNPDGKYNKSNWPGKDHGFPKNQDPGRLYSQNPNTSDNRRDDDGMGQEKREGGFGGERREGGMGGDRHEGGLGGERREGGGGFGRRR